METRDNSIAVQTKYLNSMDFRTLSASDQTIVDTGDFEQHKEKVFDCFWILQGLLTCQLQQNILKVFLSASAFETTLKCSWPQGKSS